MERSCGSTCRFSCLISAFSCRAPLTGGDMRPCARRQRHHGRFRGTARTSSSASPAADCIPHVDIFWNVPFIVQLLFFYYCSSRDRSLYRCLHDGRDRVVDCRWRPRLGCDPRRHPCNRLGHHRSSRGERAFTACGVHLHHPADRTQDLGAPARLGSHQLDPHLVDPLHHHAQRVDRFGTDVVSQTYRPFEVYVVRSLSMLP